MPAPERPLDGSAHVAERPICDIRIVKFKARKRTSISISLDNTADHVQRAACVEAELIVPKLLAEGEVGRGQLRRQPRGTDYLVCDVVSRGTIVVVFLPAERNGVGQHQLTGKLLPIYKSNAKNVVCKSKFNAFRVGSMDAKVPFNELLRHRDVAWGRKGDDQRGQLMADKRLRRPTAKPIETSSAFVSG